MDLMAFSTVTEKEVTSPHIKAGQYLEWITDLPTHSSSPRISPVFLLKSNKCYFRFIFFKNSWYKICLKFNNKCRDLDACRVRFQVGFKSEETLSLHKGEFEVSEKLNFWSIALTELESKLPPDCKMCDGFKFRFYFDNVPLLKFDEEPGGTAVQTPKYMDDNALFANVSKKFSKLFDEGVDHNVEFVCGDEIIKAHKHVLFCHSDVFASMFRHGMCMLESQTTHIEIQNLEPFIFKEFLRYLYTGVLPDLTVDVALELYKAADIYAIEALKTQCVSFLSENLSPEKALDILIVVDRHGDLDYKNSVMEYVIKEKIQFMEEKWIDFCAENPTLASEVFSLFCQKVQRKKRKTEL